MSRNSDTLLDFARYCEDHPQERFWQALRNWSDFDFIFGTSSWSGAKLIEEYRYGVDDTFYREGK